MQIKALLDVDIVAVESDDKLSVLLELTAPSGDASRTRPPANLQIVLDRSGSMQGERLDAAKCAIESLITRLDPTDRFGVVTFDDAVEVAIPLAPLTDKDAARAVSARSSPAA
jgi:Ca-activated chloride channel homolog